MAKVDTSAYRSFEEIGARLDEITSQVKDKGTPLERSLDLFDEAIALGSRAVDLVDAIEFTPEEEALAQAAAEAESGIASDSGQPSQAVDHADTPTEG